MPANQRRVVLLWDKFTRDYLSLECIRAHLLRLDPGLEVSIEHQDFFITPRGTDFFERTAQRATLVVMPSFNYRRMDSVLARVVRQGAAVAMAHSEQLFPPIFNESKLNLSYKDRYRALVAGHLVWGSFYAHELRQSIGAPAASIYICGNPKLAVLASRLEQLRCSGPRRSRPQVLVLSNFLVADFSDQDWNMFRRRWFIPPGYPLNRWFAEVRDSCLRWVRELAEQHPEVDFMLRPHPGEEVSPYRACSAPNIRITGGDELVVDLAQADLVLTYTSSAALESIAAGIPTFSMNVRSMPEETVQPPPGMHAWTTLPQLHALVDDLAAGRTAKLQPTAGQRRALEESSQPSSIDAWACHAAAIHHLLRDVRPPALTAVERARAGWFVLRMHLRAAILGWAFGTQLAQVRARASAWLDRRERGMLKKGDLVAPETKAQARAMAGNLVAGAARASEAPVLVTGEDGWTVP